MAESDSANRPSSPFSRLDHIGVIVADIDDALSLYAGRLGLSVVHRETLLDQGTVVAHLGLGACTLQLIQPLADDHPLSARLTGGDLLHHLCFRVPDLEDAIRQLPNHRLRSQDPVPRSGPWGRRAVFVGATDAKPVLLELTSEH